MGLRMGMEVIVGGPLDPPQAITAGRPVTDRMVPTAQRARKIAYAPDLDGQADPGEIVWTWVVFEDDPTRGKDRPVLVVGRDRRTLLGLMLSSQNYHSDDPAWVGIGAGPHCGGQVLVLHDMLGLSARQPPFAPARINLRAIVLAALREYHRDVSERAFPAA